METDFGCLFVFVAVPAFFLLKCFYVLELWLMYTEQTKSGITKYKVLGGRKMYMVNVTMQRYWYR